jgi:flavodoxin I
VLLCVLILTRYLRFSLPQYYCDAAGELYDLFEKAGCNMVGFTSTDGYEHSASKAERDGKFIGLMCDEDNQYDLSEDRAKAWVDQLKGEGVF